MESKRPSRLTRHISLLEGLRIFVRWAAMTAVIFGLASFIQVAALWLFNPPFSSFQLMEKLENKKNTHFFLPWTPLDEISPNMARAVLASEDQRFYEHYGFDWKELEAAWKMGIRSGHFRGASTITMQTARNLFLTPDRSLIRKAFEAYYTVLLEIMLPKNRILEIYLNVAEFGPGLYGIGSASDAYYGRPPSKLTQTQSARLALVLPSPKKYSPLKLTSYMAKRQKFILNQMKQIKLEDWPK